MTKPLEVKKYEAFLKLVGWKLEKGGIDYSLIDENGNFLCSIKINHAKNVKREISALSIRKTIKEFKERGWLWPPKQKLKNI